MKKLQVIILVISIFFCMGIFTTCSDMTIPDFLEKNLPIALADLAHYLSKQPNNPSDPITVKLAPFTFTNGDSTLPSTVEWNEVNRIVNDAQKSLILDLSWCRAESGAINGSNSPASTDNFMNIIRDNIYMKGIILPNNLGSIGNNAFDTCSYLETIVIPDSVTTIGDYAFNNCSSLENIILPESLTTIGNNAFSSCVKFTRIYIPDNVFKIGDDAFSACDDLTEVYLPAGIDKTTNFGGNAFLGIDTLRTEYSDATGAWYRTNNGGTSWGRVS
jgi:hypothetical protein